MRALRRAFCEHPASVNETYIQHLLSASSFGIRMVFAGIACLVHAALPFLFVSTASNSIRELHNRMVTNRARILESTPRTSEPAQR